VLEIAKQCPGLQNTSFTIDGLPNARKLTLRQGEARSVNSQSRSDIP